MESSQGTCTTLSSASLKNSARLRLHMKTIHVSTYGSGRPQIQLRGRWLEELGYWPGQNLEIESRGDEVTIRRGPGHDCKDAYAGRSSVSEDLAALHASDYRVEVYLRPPKSADRPKISGPASVARFFEPLRQRDREAFWAVYLDSRHRVSGVEEVSVGSVSRTFAHPREVYKGAILSNAVGLVVAHNHPSGDLAPSAEDRSLTKRLTRAGELLGIALLDHLIIGADGYESFQEKGWL